MLNQSTIYLYYNRWIMPIIRMTRWPITSLERYSSTLLTYIHTPHIRIWTIERENMICHCYLYPPAVCVSICPFPLVIIVIGDNFNNTQPFCRHRIKLTYWGENVFRDVCILLQFKVITTVCLATWQFASVLHTHTSHNPTPTVKSNREWQ